MEEGNIFSYFFGVILDTKTYLSIIYLLLSFPLSIFYILTFFSVFIFGLSLLIFWVGLPIMLISIAMAKGYATFERQLSAKVLGIGIKQPRKRNKKLSAWKSFISNLVDARNWKLLFYLLLKVALGFISFTVLITCIVGSLIVAIVPILFILQGVNFTYYTISGPIEALLISLLGIVTLFISLHLINALANLSGLFARLFLDQ